MQPRRILLTGASGFVGRHLAPALQAEFPDAALHPLAADITDAAAMTAEVAALRPDACVHLAAISAIGPARADPDLAWRVNLHGTLHLARAIQAHTPDCVLIFASSAEAYGLSFRPGGALPETAPLAPMNTYAATKAAADLALGALACEGLRAIRLRPFNHTGPGQTDAFVIPAFARQVALIALGRQDPMIRVGALDPKRDFLDVRDVCAAYTACLRRAEALPRGTILNIASGQPRRIGDVLEALLKLAGVHAQIEPDPARMRPSEIPISCGDASAARRLLDWAPRIAWEQTLADVLADWRERLG